MKRSTAGEECDNGSEVWVIEWEHGKRDQEADQMGVEEEVSYGFFVGAQKYASYACMMTKKNQMDKATDNKGTGDERR